MSSCFSTALNSISSERGYKMAFLNIFSLAKNIDEIRYSIHKTRLDSSFADDMIHLDGYNLVTKDRLRKGRAFACIFVPISIIKSKLTYVYS